jgi:flagellar biosynthetic protein FliS
MNHRSIASHYNHTNTQGATPIGLIVIQFDQVLRDLRRALAAIDSGDVESRTVHINHAILVIAQLQNVLDHDRGQQAAKRFEQFYNITRAMLVQAQFGASRQILQQCIEMYLTLRQAWHQAEVTQRSYPDRAKGRTTLESPQPRSPESPATTPLEMNWRA